MLQSLSSVEFLVQAAFSAASLVIALWCVRRSLVSETGARTGELVWSIVAAVIFVAVTIAVRFGGGLGS